MLAVCMGRIERRLRRAWDGVKDGFAIVRTPSIYLRRVVIFQLAGWGCRAAAMYYFLHAFGIPSDWREATIALSAGSVATLMPLTPGGVGPQQAILVYMFRGVAPKAATLSFSVGQQFATTIANVAVGGICVALVLRRLPWRARSVVEEARHEEIVSSEAAGPPTS